MQGRRKELRKLCKVDVKTTQFTQLNCKKIKWLSCTSINWIRSFAPGHGNNFHGKHILWLSKSVRYASVCRRQSAGEAQGGPFRHQTDTRHIAGGMWRWDWWTGNSRTEEHSFWTIPSHAETTEQLHTPSSGDKAVRLTMITT